jgi:hypothetical protein
MRIIKVSKNETLDKNMAQILEALEDTQDIHYSQKIMPGMAFLYLTMPHITTKISSVKLEFLEMRKYPLEFNIKIENKENESTYTIEDAKGKIANFEFKNSSKQSNDLKFPHIYTIGGKLIKQFSEDSRINTETALMYLRQSLIFTGEAITSEDIFYPSEPTDSLKSPEVNLAYKNSEGKISAEGTARLRIISKNTLERIIQKIS